jgi:hypothetical protein
MDATFVVANANFILAELIRELHALKTDEAQQLVDAVAERRIPLVWQSGKVKRVLVPNAKLEEQVLMLIAGASGEVVVADVIDWLDYKQPRYVRRVLTKMHSERKINLSKDGKTLEVLPPGSAAVSAVVDKYHVKL